MSLKNLTIQKKLAIPTVAIALLVILGNMYAIINSQKLARDSRELQNVFINAIDLGLNADRDLYQALTASNELIDGYLLNENNTQSAKDSFYDNAQQAFDRMESMRGLLANYPKALESSRSFNRDYQNWFDQADQVIKLAESGNVQQAANKNRTEVLGLFETLRSHYDVSVEAVKAEADNLANQAQQRADQQFSGMLVMLVAVLIASAVNLFLSPKLITYRINALITRVKQLSEGEGDLKTRLDGSGKDELSDLANRFNLFLDCLQQMVKMIKEDAKTMDGTVSTLNSSVTNSNGIVSTQNDNLTQIASAVNEMSYAIHEIAGNAQKAQSETTEATSTAQETKLTVDDTVVKVSGLSNTVQSASTVISNLANESANIVQVLDVIKGIAEQTNLLALNAAIEAARAGEQGRGFAVVADEVRTLASRTQQSTQDIQNMISSLESGVNQAVSAMEAGTSQMTDVTEQSKLLQTRLESLTDAITKTGDIVIQIASATEEQSYVTDEITRNVNTLNELSTQVLENSKQTATVASTMSEMSVGLNKTVGRFVV